MENTETKTVLRIDKEDLFSILQVEMADVVRKGVEEERDIFLSEYNLPEGLEVQDYSGEFEEDIILFKYNDNFEPDDLLDDSELSSYHSSDDDDKEIEDFFEDEESLLERKIDAALQYAREQQFDDDIWVRFEPKETQKIQPVLGIDGSVGLFGENLENVRIPLVTWSGYKQILERIQQQLKIESINRQINISFTEDFPKTEEEFLEFRSKSWEDLAICCENKFSEFLEFLNSIAMKK